MKNSIRRLPILVLWCAASTWANAQATFERLGFASIENPSSRSLGISSDGRFVVGYTGNRAFRWSRREGMLVLQQAGLFDSASAVSKDGGVIVGDCYQQGVGDRPIAWVNGELRFLTTEPITTSGTGGADDVTDDGRTIVGGVMLGWPHGAFLAARWRDGKVEDLSGLPGDIIPTGIVAVAEDGHPATLAGGGWDAGHRSIRIHRDRVSQLGDIPGSGRGMEQTASDISDDGRRIIGGSSSATVRHGEAYLWSEPTGMVGLGTIPSNFMLSKAQAISGDGRVVGGLTGTNRLYIYRGFIWDPVRGMRHLDAVLDALGVDRRGWSIEFVTAISRDGTAMTGSAYDPTVTRGEAFLVTLPPWCWADCTGDDVVDFNDLICFLNRFEGAQNPRVNPIDFFYCDLAPDDTIDFNDFLAFLNLYNRGCP